MGCCNDDSASLGLRLLGLGNQKVKNLCGLAGKFDLDQSEGKSSQNNARARNAGPNKSQGDLRFQIASILTLKTVHSGGIDQASFYYYDSFPGTVYRL